MSAVKVFLKQDGLSQQVLVDAEIDTMASNPLRGAHKHSSGEYYMIVGLTIPRALLDLKKGAVPKAAIERISFEWGRDTRFSEEKVKGGVYEYKGAAIAIRWFQNSGNGGSWRQADISVDCPNVDSFEEVFKLLCSDDFSTEQLKS